MVDVVELKQDTQVDMKTGQVGIVQSDKNGGFSAGNNIGIRIAMKDADCTHIWLLNNDTVVNKYTLRKSLDHFVHYSHLGILGSKLIMYEKPEYLQGYGASFNVLSGKSTILGFKSSSNIESPVLMSPDCVIGASMLVSRSYIEQVGYLDDRYFLYKEELDWALRGKSKSFKCMASMNTGIYHKQGVTTGNKLGGKRNLQSMYYMLQSHLIFYRKFYYYLLPVAYLVVLYRILKMSIKNGEEYLSLLKPYFRGFDV
jgi:GT2 family glycosyltransferase